MLGRPLNSGPRAWSGRSGQVRSDLSTLCRGRCCGAAGLAVLGFAVKTILVGCQHLVPITPAISQALRASINRHHYYETSNILLRELRLFATPYT